MKPDIQLFKRCMGKFATGVTIVTTLALDGSKVGVTVNSLNSVSLDPLLILFSIKKTSHFHEHIFQAKNYIVNILSEKQKHISQLFTKQMPENWHEVELVESQNNCPALADTLAFLECEIEHQYDGGDHTIFISKVTNLVEQKHDSPLVYFASEYRKLDEYLKP